MVPGPTRRIVNYSELIEQEFEQVGIQVDHDRASLLSQYCVLLERWKEQVNLTALSGLQLVRRLVISPLALAERLELSGVLADVGSGNGSPGLPLAIWRPWSSVHLIEPRLRRAAFLRHVVASLGLPGLTIHRARVEEVTGEIGTVDWISLQGIRPSPELLRVLALLSTPETRILWFSSELTVPPGVICVRRVEVPSLSVSVQILTLDQS